MPIWPRIQSTQNERIGIRNRTFSNLLLEKSQRWKTRALSSRSSSQRNFTEHLEFLRPGSTLAGSLSNVLDPVNGAITKVDLDLPASLP